MALKLVALSEPLAQFLKWTVSLVALLPELLGQQSVARGLLQHHIQVPHVPRSLADFLELPRPPFAIPFWQQRAEQLDGGCRAAAPGPQLVDLVRLIATAFDGPLQVPGHPVQARGETLPRDFADF